MCFNNTHVPQPDSCTVKLLEFEFYVQIKYRFVYTINPSLYCTPLSFTPRYGGHKTPQNDTSPLPSKRIGN